MHKILTICGLTIKAAVRYRLLAVVSVLLMIGVVGLPLIIRDDGSARGFAQIVLAYTLSLTTGLLGFVTLWLACGTLAREISEAQIQMVVVKPISRWQIWVGKWLGLMTINAVLLTIAGIAIFVLLNYRANQLPVDQQAVLKNEVLVARTSVKEPIPDYTGDAKKYLVERFKQSLPPPGTDLKAVEKMAIERIKAEYQIVAPGYLRQWNIDLGVARHFLGDQPLFIRTKFNVAETNASGNYLGLWEIGPTDSPKAYRERMNLSDNTFHEFAIPPNLFDDKGMLTIRFINRNDTAVLFTLEEGLEVLYKDGGFGLNFARGIGILFCWLAFLAALGLAASSLLSFPVATFVTLGVLFVAFSSGTLKQVVEEGGISGVNHDTGVIDAPAPIDHLSVPLAKTLLGVIDTVKDFSPVDALASGRSITWSELARAVFQIVIIMGGTMGALGIYCFSRRELAGTQSTT